MAWRCQHQTSVLNRLACVKHMQILLYDVYDHDVRLHAELMAQMNNSIPVGFLYSD